MELFKAASITDWPIDCSTMWIIPAATSSNDELLSAFPKVDAVAYVHQKEKQ